MSRRANRPTNDNYQDYLIDFSNVDFSQYGDIQPQQEEPKEEPSFWEKAYNSGAAILEGLTMMPQGVWDTVKDTWNGGEIDVMDRAAIEERRQREAEKQAYQQKWEGKTFGGVSDAMVSMPYSVATMGAALGAGTAGMLAGPVAGGAAAMGASGAVAYRATKQDFLHRLLDKTEDALGRTPTQDEWNRIASEFDSEATKYGAYEAIPEAVGNLLFMKLLGPLGNKLLKGGIGSAAKRVGGAYGEEFATETVTQMGQGDVEAEMGWRDEAPNAWEAFKEIAPATFWQTTLMGGGKKVADYAYNRLTKRKEDVGNNADETQKPFSVPAGEGQENAPAFENPFPMQQWDAPNARDERLEHEWNLLAEQRERERKQANQQRYLMNAWDEFFASDNPQQEQPEISARQRQGLFGAWDDFAQNQQPQQNERQVLYWPQREGLFGAWDEMFPQQAKPSMQDQMNGGETVDLLNPQESERTVAEPQVASEPAQAATPQIPQPVQNIQQPVQPMPPEGMLGGIPGFLENAAPQAAPQITPSPIPAQSELTNTQQAPRADTLQPAEQLGMPAPQAIPQVAQPAQPMPQMPQQAQYQPAPQQPLAGMPGFQPAMQENDQVQSSIEKDIQKMWLEEINANGNAGLQAEPELAPASNETGTDVELPANERGVENAGQETGKQPGVPGLQQRDSGSDVQLPDGNEAGTARGRAQESGEGNSEQEGTGRNRRKLKIPNRPDEDVSFELREADDVQASHLPEAGFQRNPRYQFENERRYHDEPASRADVLDHARELDPEMLMESVDASQGAPIIDKAGNVLGGNSRAMSIRHAYDKFPQRAEAYRQALKERAESLGLDPAQIDRMKRPMLVRSMDRDMDARERQELVPALNDSFTKSKDKRASGKSRGDRLTPKTLEALGRGLQEADSLREYFDKSESASVVEMLIRDGVIQPTERNAFVAEDGQLNPDGKKIVEEALRGRVARSYEALDALPAAVIGKIDAAIPYVLIAENVGGEWNITPHVRDAVDLVAEFQASKTDKPQTFLKQLDMTKGGKAPMERYSPQAQSLFLMMLDAKKKEFANAFARFASQAKLSTGGMGVGLESDVAFDESFEGKRRAELIDMLPKEEVHNARRKMTNQQIKERLKEIQREKRERQGQQTKEAERRKQEQAKIREDLANTPQEIRIEPTDNEIVAARKLVRQLGNGGRGRSANDEAVILLRMAKTLGEISGESPAQILAKVNFSFNAPVDQQIENALQSYLQEAWHGTPFNDKITQLSTDYLSTGEGGQVHGWGLYVALTEKTARERYQHRLSLQQNDGIWWEAYVLLHKSEDEKTEQEKAFDEIVKRLQPHDEESFVKEMNRLIRENNKIIKNEESDSDDIRGARKDNRKLRLAKSELLDGNGWFTVHYAENGQRLRLKIPEDTVMLREESKMADQPNRVKKACKELIEEIYGQKINEYVQQINDGGINLDELIEINNKREMLMREQKRLLENANGEDFYWTLVKQLGSPKAASLKLLEKGVKGIRYEGEVDGECAVIFNGESIKIVERFYDQQGRGRVDFLNDGTARILFGKSADASTAIHEFEHFFVNEAGRILKDQTIPDSAAKRQLARDMEALGRFGGETDNAANPHEWSVSTQEKIAGAFEQYLRTGEAPENSGLKGIFRRMRDLLVQIYNRAKEIIGLENLSEDIKKVFGRQITTFNERESKDNENARGKATEKDYGTIDNSGTPVLENMSRNKLLEQLKETDRKYGKSLTKPKLVDFVRKSLKEYERHYLGKNSTGQDIYVDGTGKRVISDKNGNERVQPVLFGVNGMEAPSAEELYSSVMSGRQFLTKEELENFEQSGQKQSGETASKGKGEVVESVANLENDNDEAIRKSPEQPMVGQPADVADRGERAATDNEVVEQPKSSKPSGRPGHGSNPGNETGDDSRRDTGRFENRNDSGSDMSGSRDISGGRNTGRDKEANPEMGGENQGGRGEDGGRQDSGNVGKDSTKPKNANNHRIAEEDILVPGGNAVRAKANITAIKLLQKLDAEKRPATPEEKKILQQFTGWGSLAQTVFNPDFERIAEQDARGARIDLFYDSDLLSKYRKWKKEYGEVLYPKMGGILTEEEWAAAAKSTLNAHYTDRKVISAMWKMVEKMGFRSGRILEPSAGTGLFFGLMPENISQNSNLAGVELDRISGKILKYLYPDADIQISGYENAKRLGDNTVDLAISNVPFGNFSVFDKKRPQYSKQSIHNYFFSRTLDTVRPGGLVAFITSHFTMDAAIGQIREEWGRKADMVAAVRLPGDAFKKNAGTDVTTDIIIFRKKSDSDFALGQQFRNLKEIQTKDGPATINEYFVAHPEMVLGEHSLQGSMYGGNEYTLLSRPGESIETALDRAIENIPSDIYGVEAQNTEQASNQDVREAEKSAKEGTLVEQDGKVWLVNDGTLEAPSWVGKKDKVDQAKEYNKLKETASSLIKAMNEDKNDNRVEALRNDLNKQYDAYRKKYGAINDKKSSFLQEDLEFPSVAALEDVKEIPVDKIIKSGPNKGKTRTDTEKQYSKADIFSKRTIFPFSPPDRADSPQDAVKISRIYKNKIDLPYIASMLGANIEQAKQRLLETGEVFENPENGLLEPKDVYLSGNVREKLQRATESAKDNPAYEPNVKALKEVQPERINITNINAKIGSSWLPADVYESFMKHLGVENPSVSRVRVEGEEGTTNWKVGGYGLSAEARNVWGTSRAGIFDILQDCLNLKRTVVMDHFKEDGKPRSARNEAETLAAQEKQRLLQEEFSKWLPQSDVASEVEDLYNETFNGFVKRHFEVPDIKYYPGANQSIELRDNQKKGVSRALQESCLLAHGVGSGKTMLQITLAMEMRRLGTAKKPWIVVQDATLSQFAASFKELYPGAKILAPTKEQREAKNRRRLLAQIASGDWDAIITPHGFFNGVAVSPETETRFIQEQIEEYTNILMSVEDSDRNTRKAIEKKIEKLRQKLLELADTRKDENVYFDDLGIDALIIDEAHAYKRGMFVTKMDNVKGLDRDSSQRSLQLLMKSRMVQAKTGGKNVILATGTPISNTLTEMWTMFRYIRPDLLKQFHVEQFDDFATAFADTSVTQEETATGEWKDVERFNKYVNGPELLTLWSLGADVAITEDLSSIKNLPKLKGGKIHEVAIERSEALSNYIEALREERIAWDNLPGKEKREKSWVPLTIYGRAKQAAIDLRLVDPTLADEPVSKANAAVKNIFERWQSSSAQQSTQIVFSDTFQSSDKSFNLFKDIKDKLVKLGIPAKEIAIIHDYKTDDARKKLFDRVVEGEVRVLMGTTEKLGVGVNVQKRLMTAHHLDAPQRPMDFEQRNGRIRRPGNMNSEVEILTYGTKNTLDSVTFQQLISKQKFINQLMRGNVAERTFENPFDSTQATFEDMMAAFSGNPLAKEKMQLTSEVRNLRTKQSAHYSQISQQRASLQGLKNALKNAHDRIPLEEKAIEFLKKNFPDNKIPNRKELSRDVGDWLKAQEKKTLDRLEKIETEAQWYTLDKKAITFRKEFDLGNGVKVNIEIAPEWSKEFTHYLDRESEETIHKGVIQKYELSGPHDITEKSDFNGATGLFTRLENALARRYGWAAASQQRIADLEKQIKVVEKETQRPFAQQDELDKAEKRLKEVEAELEKTTAAESKKESVTQEKPLSEMTPEELKQYLEANSGIQLEGGTVWGDGTVTPPNASIKPSQFLPSRNENARGTRAVAVRNTIEALNRSAKNAANTEVVQSFADLPQHIREEFEGKTVEAAYDPRTKKVWFVADNIENATRAAEVWAHEQIVHHGLRGMLSEGDRTRMLNSLWLKMGGMGNPLIKERAKLYGLKPTVNSSQIPLLMEEVIAHLAETKKLGKLNERQQSMWRNIVNAILRAWNKIVERVTGRKANMGYEQADNLLTALGNYVINGENAFDLQADTAGAMASVGEGKVNSYGVPMERVTVIVGNITQEELGKALEELSGRNLINILEGLTAQVNSNQRTKLVSAVARAKSMANGFTGNEHNIAASKIENAWKWAAEVPGMGGSKPEQKDVKIRRFFSAVSINGKDAFLELTVKDSNAGLRLYSAELLNEKELRVKLGDADNNSSTSPRRSFNEIIDRLKGPVNEADAPLASLNLRDIVRMGSRQAAQLANEPEIRHLFKKNDLTLLQNVVQLPHWIAKQFKEFADIYNRQLKRMDERSAAVMKSLETVPSLFGKNRLGKQDMDSLRELLWQLEGAETKLEQDRKVEKFISDGTLANGRTKLAINPKFYDVYQEVLDEHSATTKAKAAMMEIRKSLDNDLLLAYNRMASMEEMADDAIKQLRENIGHVPNYFPHHRYGKYFIQAKKDGEVVFRQHFDALNEKLAQAKAREIVRQQQANYPDAEWMDGENSKLPDEVLGAPIDSSAMEQIIRAATSKIGDKEKAAQINDLLVKSVADVLKTRGWGSHGIQRKGVPGYETEDIEKVLYDYKSGLNGWLTKMEAARDFSSMLGKIDAQKQPKLWKYASQYIKDMLRNSDNIDRTVGKIKSAAFAWYLGANIKTAFVNATQNLIVGVPRLQMDVKGGGRLWLTGAQDALVDQITGKKGNNLTDNEYQMLRKLYDQNVITDAFMEEVRGHMEGFSGANAWNKFTKIMGLPMSMVERFNRASLALAAYRAATRGALKAAAKKKYGINDKATHEQAIKFATEVVRDAHFVYGKTNMPEFMRSNAAGRAISSMYTFRTFSHNMLAMWAWALKTQGREGAIFTAKSLGATMALGGVTALPLYATLMALFQLASGDDDDWTEMIRDSLPNDNLLRDVVCYGMPAIAGVNVGGSLKMETPLTRGLRAGATPEEVLTKSIGDIIGIPYDLGIVRTSRVMDAVDKGNYWRAIEEAVPTFVKNGMQAWRLYAEGQTTMAGRPINSPGQKGARKLTESEAIAKALGFQPVSSTKSYDAYSAQKRHETVRSDKLNEVTIIALKAYDTGDKTYQRKAIKEMEVWNERMKKEGKLYMMFNWKDVMRRVKARRRENSNNPKQLEKGGRQLATWGI